MSKRWLVELDVCALIVVILILVLTWLYLPHEMFGWGVLLAVFVLALAAYQNAKYFAYSIIRTRRKASGKPGPLPKKAWLASFNNAVAIVILAILVLSWFYLPHELVGWGFRLALLLLLLACLVNFWSIVADYLDSGKTAA